MVWSRVVNLVFALGLVAWSVAAGQTPTTIGDYNLDWSVDEADADLALACMTGPTESAVAECADCDLDLDGDVDLADYAALLGHVSGPQVLTYSINDDADDGTETEDGVWYSNGVAGDGLNRFGSGEEHVYNSAFRFHVPDLEQGEQFQCARLILPGTGDGQVNSMANMRIVGVDADGVESFDVTPPKMLPRTVASVTWEIDGNWPKQTDDLYGSPLLRYGPDIAPIINEILARPQWGSGVGGKTIALIIEGDASGAGNFLTFRDRGVFVEGDKTYTIATNVELYCTLRSTFVGKELLGRPTDHSVTVNACSLVSIDAYFEHSDKSGTYERATPIASYDAGEPIESVIEGLSASTRYYYRIRFRRSGEGEFEAGPERTFRTARAQGRSFAFTVQADSHLYGNERDNEVGNRDLYRRCLASALRDAPDFHVDLGDTFLSESYRRRDVLDYDEAIQRHLAQRPFLDMICHSAPLFVALGNHEGEQGWRLDGTAENVAVWATNARKEIYPLPEPDGFYTGNEDDVAFTGLREDYYSWEWGDALFVVIDPYWYTIEKPHSVPPSPTGSGDNWDWTLGESQYEWLRTTLSQSSARFKFVFSHQVTGGVNLYGRGGVEAASHGLGGYGSFEWGGYDSCGDYLFDSLRPGWDQPIHDLMVQNNVTIFFHGHDHVFVKQVLDGIVYQACPQPLDTTYGLGHFDDGQYVLGDAMNNSGYLRVFVKKTGVTVEYVRIFLEGDGDSGQVAYSYTIAATSGD